MYLYKSTSLCTPHNVNGEHKLGTILGTASSDVRGFPSATILDSPYKFLIESNPRQTSNIHRLVTADINELRVEIETVTRWKAQLDK